MYAQIHPDLPILVTKEWGYRHRRHFIYALLCMGAGVLVALCLIGGFVYLVMQGHEGPAKWLLGAGAVGIVSGFLASRLDK